MGVKPGGEAVRAPRLVRWVARALFALHPPSFRRRWAAEFDEAVKHRYAREREKKRRGAIWRTVSVLTADAIRSVPAEWWEAAWGGLPARRVGELGRGSIMGWIEGWSWDIRIAVRGLIRRPRLSLLVAGTVALGIAANVSIFGALDRIVLNPLPFDRDGRAWYVMGHDAARNSHSAVPQEWFDRWRDGASSVERLEVFQGTGGLLTGLDEPRPVTGVRVTLGFADMIGARPLAGRTFVLDDALPDTTTTVMISEALWRDAYDSDPGIVGRTIEISGLARTVIGVWPQSGRFTLTQQPDYFEPVAPGREIDRSRLSVAIALLAPNHTRESAETELAAMAAAVDGDSGRSTTVSVPRLVRPIVLVGEAFANALWIVFGGVGLLLVVAAVNSGGMLLQRAIDREQELGVRLALGAGGRRLFRHFLLESAVLVGFGLMLGLGLARWATAGFASLAPEDIPDAALAGATGRTIAYALVLGVALTAVSAIVPAIHIRTRRIRSIVGEGSRTGTTGWGRLGGGLVAAQVALAVLLLVGSALTLRSFDAMRSIDLGYSLEQMAIVTVRVPFTDESDDVRAARAQQTRSALTAITGVEAAAASPVLPLNYSWARGEPYLEGDPPPVANADAMTSVASIAPGLLDVFDISIVDGRAFTDEEMEQGYDTHAVVVNASFAARYTESIVGRTLLFQDETSPPLRIVGVVEDVRTGDITEPFVRPQVYYPGDGVTTWNAQRYLVRFSGPVEGVVGAIRDRITAVEPGALVTEIRLGEELLESRWSGFRFMAVLMTAFGGLALLLALTGVFGAVSLHVSRRTREVGVRMALGAVPSTLVRDVSKVGLRPVALGLVLGMIAATALSGVLVDLLYQITPRDPASFALAAVLLSITALVAAALPARAATRVDPTVALRSE